MNSGTDLATHLRAHGPLAPPRVARVVSAIAPGIDAADAAGSAHGRISPAAILIAPGPASPGPGASGPGAPGPGAPGSGAPGADEIITLAAPETQGDPVVFGAHAAPEVLGGAAPDVRSDVFSLASTVYTLLSGAAPNPYGIATLRRLRPDLDPRVDAVLTRATARGPEFRYASATAFAADLDAALRGGRAERTTGHGDARDEGRRGRHHRRWNLPFSGRRG